MSELKQSSVALLEKAIDEKVRRAQSKGGTTLATVTRIDNDGTTWVHVFGGADETPVRRMTSSAKVGDTISVAFSGLSCNGVGNISSPAATQKQVQQLSNESAQAIRGVMNGLLQLRTLVADKVSTRQLTAEVAEIMDAQIYELTATMAEILNLEATYADIKLANVNALEVEVEKVHELFARSGLFDNLTVTGDGTITGRLNAVLLDGDTARFSNIYADALKILGQDGLYHALNMAGLTEEDARIMVDSYGESLDGGLHGSHIIAETITASQIDVTSLVAAMLLAEFVQIGATGGTHIEARGDRFSFFAGGSGWDSMTDEYLYRLVDDPTGNPVAQGWYELVDGSYVMTTDTVVDAEKDYYQYTVTSENALPGEVAYIAVDEHGESMFYMTRSVVVKDLRFGDWKWFGRKNRNMALKWVGGELS